MEALAAPQLPVLQPGPPPDALAAGMRLGDRQSIDQAATGFESMFLSMVLKQMRQTLEEGGLFGNDTGDVYGGLFDLYLGQHLAAAGGLGIAAMVKRQLESTKVS